MDNLPLVAVNESTGYVAETSENIKVRNMVEKKGIILQCFKKQTRSAAESCDEIVSEEFIQISFSFYCLISGMSQFFVPVDSFRKWSKVTRKLSSHFLCERFMFKSRDTIRIGVHF